MFKNQKTKVSRSILHAGSYGEILSFFPKQWKVKKILDVVDSDKHKNGFVRVSVLQDNKIIFENIEDADDFFKEVMLEISSGRWPSMPVQRKIRSALITIDGIDYGMVIFEEA